MNIFEIPLYYISFKRSDEIENHYKEHGFKNVNHFPAVDGRKMSVNKLLEDNLITIRVHDDLRMGRVEHSGIPTKGGIGCTLSHYELWKKCVDNDWPFIIITEEDNRMKDSWKSKEVFDDINDALAKPNGVFLSGRVRTEGRYDNVVRFMGLHFYIASKDACEKMVNKVFPIDVQTDWYMSHLATIKDIHVHGRHIAKQRKAIFETTIQDDVCISCLLPRGNWFYILMVLSMIVIIYFLMRK